MGESDAIRAALAQTKRCLPCTAAASGVSARRVADELRAVVSEGADVLTYEGRCRECGEYRFLLWVQTLSPRSSLPARNRIA
jgi:hypothetical protein